MTNTRTQPTVSQRVTHVAVVALFTASLLALCGAVRDNGPRPAAKAVVAAKVVKADAVNSPAAPAVPTVAAAVRTEQAPAQLAAFKSPARQRVIRMEVTAYCACKKCCGPKAIGLTASGKHVSYDNGKFVAADRKFPFGTKLIIPGYASGRPVKVLDRGGAIKGNKLDVYFHSHKEALKW